MGMCRMKLNARSFFTDGSKSDRILLIIHDMQCKPDAAPEEKR